MSHPAGQPLTLSVEEAGRLLGISRGLAYQGVRDGSIPSISIGRRRLIPTARLLELVGAEDGHTPERRTPMYEPTRRKPDREHSDWKGAHGATQRALKARKGPASDADRPPPSTFPGRKATVLDGHLGLDGEEVRHDQSDEVPKQSEARPEPGSTRHT